MSKQLSHINEGESRDELGVPAKKRSGSARVPSPKKATASRRSDPSRARALDAKYGPMKRAFISRENRAMWNVYVDMKAGHVERHCTVRGLAAAKTARDVCNKLIQIVDASRPNSDPSR